MTLEDDIHRDTPVRETKDFIRVKSGQQVHYASRGPVRSRGRRRRLPHREHVPDRGPAGRPPVRLFAVPWSAARFVLFTHGLDFCTFGVSRQVDDCNRRGRDVTVTRGARVAW